MTDIESEWMNNYKRILSLATTHKLTQELVTALNNFFEEVKDAPDFIAVTEYHELNG